MKQLSSYYSVKCNSLILVKCYFLMQSLSTLIHLPISVQTLGITVSTSLVLWNGRPAMSCFIGSNKWSLACYPYCSCYFHQKIRCMINSLKPNDHYNGRTAPLTSKHCILYIYSTNIGTEYFKHGIYSPLFPLQNAVCFIILTYLFPVLFAFYIQGVLKFKKNNSATKRLIQKLQAGEH